MQIITAGIVVFVFRRVQTGCHSGFEDGLNASIVLHRTFSVRNGFESVRDAFASDGGISISGLHAAPSGGRSSGKQLQFAWLRY